MKTDQLDLKAIFINEYLFNRSNSFQFELLRKSITDYRNEAINVVFVTV